QFEGRRPPARVGPARLERTQKCAPRDRKAPPDRAAIRRKLCAHRHLAAQRQGDVRIAAPPWYYCAFYGRIWVSVPHPRHLRTGGGKSAISQSVWGGFKFVILTLKPEVTKGEIEAITKKIKELGFSPHMTHGKEFTIIGVIGENAILSRDIF